MTYFIGDRVVVQQDIESYGKKISSGTICTIMTEPKNESDDEIIILGLWEDCKDNKPVVFGVTKYVVRKILKEELEEENYENLTSNKFWIGSQFKACLKNIDGVDPGEVGTIVSVDLSPNELNDILTLEFSNKTFKFERQFVEMNFDYYDEEFEDMLGDEIEIKGVEKNYHFPGARMLCATLKEFVIVLEVLENDKFKVETLQHDVLEMMKSELLPITNVEGFVQMKEEDKVQQNYTTGNVLIANEDISKHILLNNRIKPNDKIEILNVDCSTVNVYEDIYMIAINEEFDKPIKITYSDLKKFFEILIKVPRKEESKTEDQMDMSIFENKDDDCGCSGFKKKDKVEEQIEIPIVIHDLSILDYRFKIGNGKFSFNSLEEYDFSEIKNLITALQELEKLGKHNK